MQLNKSQERNSAFWRCLVERSQQEMKWSTWLSFTSLPCEQRDTVVSCYTSQHTDAGQLVGEQLSVVFLQLVDLFFFMRWYAIHWLRKVSMGSGFYKSQRENVKGKVSQCVVRRIESNHGFEYNGTSISSIIVLKLMEQSASFLSCNTSSKSLGLPSLSKTHCFIMNVKWNTASESHQVPGAVRSSQVTLDVRVKNLDRWLDEAAARKMLLVLDERQPRLQQLVVRLHVNHVVLIQLSKEKKSEWMSATKCHNETQISGLCCL